MACWPLRAPMDQQASGLPANLRLALSGRKRGVRKGPFGVGSRSAAAYRQSGAAGCAASLESERRRSEIWPSEAGNNSIEQPNPDGATIGRLMRSGCPLSGQDRRAALARNPSASSRQSHLFRALERPLDSDGRSDCLNKQSFRK